MGKYTFLIILITVLTSCSTNEAYYQAPIEKWLNTNLNNPDTYEAVSFKVLDEDDQLTDYFQDQSDQYFDLKTVHQRKIDILPNLVEHFKSNGKKGTLKEIVDIRAELTLQDTMGLSGVTKLINHHDSLDKKVNDLISQSGAISELDQSTKTVIAQYEAAKDRFQNERQQLSDELEGVGLSIKNIGRYIDEGLIVYHKYRASNKTGAQVLNERLFVLDASKSKISGAKEL